MPAVVDVVIPTVEGREKSLERCIESYESGSSVELNIIIVAESKTCGWGWMQGLAAMQTDYVLLACDDQEAISTDWAGVCMDTVDMGALPCPRVWHGDGQIESNGGDMKLLNHVNPRSQKDRQEVDYTTIPFMSRKQAEVIGMLDVHYASDVWVSYRGRQLGYPTILRHGYDVVHHRAAPSRGAGMSVIQRDEMDCKTVFDKLAELGADPAEIQRVSA